MRSPDPVLLFYLRCHWKLRGWLPTLNTMLRRLRVLLPGIKWLLSAGLYVATLLFVPENLAGVIVQIEEHFFPEDNINFNLVDLSTRSITPDLSLKLGTINAVLPLFPGDASYFNFFSILEPPEDALVRRMLLLGRKDAGRSADYGLMCYAEYDKKLEDNQKQFISNLEIAFRRQSGLKLNRSGTWDEWRYFCEKIWITTESEFVFEDNIWSQSAIEDNRKLASVLSTVHSWNSPGRYGISFLFDRGAENNQQISNSFEPATLWYVRIRGIVCQQGQCQHWPLSVLNARNIIPPTRAAGIWTFFGFVLAGLVFALLTMIRRPSHAVTMFRKWRRVYIFGFVMTFSLIAHAIVDHLLLILNLDPNFQFISALLPAFVAVSLLITIQVLLSLFATIQEAGLHDMLKSRLFLPATLAAACTGGGLWRGFVILQAALIDPTTASGTAWIYTVLAYAACGLGLGAYIRRNMAENASVHFNKLLMYLCFVMILLLELDGYAHLVAGRLISVRNFLNLNILSEVIEGFNNEDWLTVGAVCLYVIIPLGALLPLIRDTDKPTNAGFSLSGVRMDAPDWTLDSSERAVAALRAKLERPLLIESPEANNDFQRLIDSRTNVLYLYGAHGSAQFEYVRALAHAILKERGGGPDENLLVLEPRDDDDEYAVFTRVPQLRGELDVATLRSGLNVRRRFLTAMEGLENRVGLFRLLDATFMFLFTLDPRESFLREEEYAAQRILTRVIRRRIQKRMQRGIFSRRTRHRMCYVLIVRNFCKLHSAHQKLLYDLQRFYRKNQKIKLLFLLTDVTDQHSSPVSHENLTQGFLLKESKFPPHPDWHRNFRGVGPELAAAFFFDTLNFSYASRNLLDELRRRYTQKPQYSTNFERIPGCLQYGRFLANIREIANHGFLYKTQDGLALRDDVLVAGLPLPPRLQAKERERLRALSDNEKRLLEFAAILGNRFDIELLAACTDSHRDAVNTRLREIQRKTDVIEEALEPNRVRVYIDNRAVESVQRSGGVSANLLESIAFIIEFPCEPVESQTGTLQLLMNAPEGGAQNFQCRGFYDHPCFLEFRQVDTNKKSERIKFQAGQVGVGGLLSISRDELEQLKQNRRSMVLFQAEVTETNSQGEQLRQVEAFLKDKGPGFVWEGEHGSKRAYLRPASEAVYRFRQPLTRSYLLNGLTYLDRNRVQRSERLKYIHKRIASELDAMYPPRQDWPTSILYRKVLHTSRSGAVSETLMRRANGYGLKHLAQTRQCAHAASVLAEMSDIWEMYTGRVFSKDYFEPVEQFIKYFAWVLMVGRQSVLELHPPLTALVHKIWYALDDENLHPEFLERNAPRLIQIAHLLSKMSAFQEDWQEMPEKIFKSWQSHYDRTGDDKFHKTDARCQLWMAVHFLDKFSGEMENIMAAHQTSQSVSQKEDRLNALKRILDEIDKHLRNYNPSMDRADASGADNDHPLRLEIQLRHDLIKSDCLQFKLEVYAKDPELFQKIFWISPCDILKSIRELSEDRPQQIVRLLSLKKKPPAFVTDHDMAVVHMRIVDLYLLHLKLLSMEEDHGFQKQSFLWLIREINYHLGIIKDLNNRLDSDYGQERFLRKWVVFYSQIRRNAHFFKRPSIVRRNMARRIADTIENALNRASGASYSRVPDLMRGIYYDMRHGVPPRVRRSFRTRLEDYFQECHDQCGQAALTNNALHATVNRLLQSVVGSGNTSGLKSGRGKGTGSGTNESERDTRVRNFILFLNEPEWIDPENECAWMDVHQFIIRETQIYDPELRRFARALLEHPWVIPYGSISSMLSIRGLYSIRSSWHEIKRRNYRQYKALNKLLRRIAKMIQNS